MLFFLEIQLFGSTQLWRSATRLPGHFKKGLVDDTNLKTKVDYFSGPEMLTLLHGALQETGGVIVRKGRLTNVYYLVFLSEGSLNNFIRDYASLFLTVPVLVVNYVQNTTCRYRLDDYISLVTSKQQTFTNVPMFLEMNLTTRYYHFKQASVVFFTKLQWLLASSKK